MMYESRLTILTKNFQGGHVGTSLFAHHFSHVDV